jgi:hypothetical protein
MPKVGRVALSLIHDDARLALGGAAPSSEIPLQKIETAAMEPVYDRPARAASIVPCIPGPAPPRCTRDLVGGQKGVRPSLVHPVLRTKCDGH